ncbi:MAG: glycosyltransferase, partial [Bacteroidetes bacterium]|nr:glycosyltransferase [Bacteroidota bacterium]
MINPLSIIIPIRNECNFISNALDSIINQDFSRYNLEIIIADGMSDDGTREIIQNYHDKYPNIKIIDNPGRIVPT